jgi:hypothetical protein
VVTAAGFAVVAGYRSYAAIAEWGRRRPRHGRTFAGRRSRPAPPSEAMIRRLLRAMDPELWTAAISVWLEGRATAGT